MRRSNTTRIVAFIMAFIMALSVVFQSDMAIGGLANVLAAVSDASQGGAGEYGIATQSDAAELNTAQLADADIDLSADGYEIYVNPNAKNVYAEGAEIKPKVYVRKTGTETYLDTEMYSVEYSNNINAGTAIVTVTGNSAAGCTGTITGTFTIAKKQIYSESLIYLDGKESANRYSKNKNKIYTYTAGGVFPEIYVKGSSRGKFLTENVDYTVIYHNSDKAGVVTSDKANGISAEIISRNDNYVMGAESDKGSFYVFFGIKAANMSDQKIQVAGETQPYTGKKVKPEIIVYDAQTGDQLDGPGTKDPEYTVEYDENNCTEPGEKKATVKGVDGRYSGSVEVNYTILEPGAAVKKISDARVTFADELTYNGQAQEPEPIVTYKGTVLKKDVDYKILGYSNNIEVTTTTSKGHVVITGCGDYSGSYTADFNIARRDIGGSDFSYTATDAVYKTKDNTPMWSGINVTVTDSGLNRTLLGNGKEYTLDFTEYYNLNKYSVGTYPFKIKGTGNYTGTMTGEFKIVPADLSDAVITADPVDYTGSAVEPDKLTVTYNGTNLVDKTDYEITGCDNNVSIGDKAIVTIKGLGNYTGTASGYFTIKSDGIKSISSVTVQMPTYYTYTGKQIKPEAVLTDGDYTLVEGTDYTASYGSNKLPGASAGEVTFIGAGSYTGSKKATFRINQKQISDDDVICTYQDTYTYTGSDITPDIKLTYNGIDLVEGENNDYILLNCPKEVTGDKKFDIIIRAVSGGCFYGTRDVYVSVVSPAGEMTGLDYLAIPDQTYTGSEIKPALTIKNGDYTLSEGIDYEVTERTNNIDVGTSTIKIEGKGSYSGNKILQFNIVPKDINDCTMSNIGDFTYMMGNAICPAVKLMNGNNELEQDTDYEAKYENNINVTTTDKAKITITALSSNYTGEKVVYFNIKPLTIEKNTNGFSMTNVTADREYTGSRITPAVEVLQEGQALILDKDYTVTYGENTNVGDVASVTVTGIGNFDGSVDMKFNITKKTLTLSMVSDIPNQKYTGDPIEPEVTVTHGSIVLVEGTDYELAYTNNTDIGTATAYVKSIGSNYTGEVKKTFVISDNVVDFTGSDKLVVTGLKDQVYDFGNPIKPEVTVTYDGTALVSGRDYTCTYNNNRSAGVATLNVLGKGIYGGKKSYTFNIAKYDISKDSLVLEKNSYEYTGKEITPAPKAINVGGTDKSVNFSEFDITYANNESVGDGTVNIAAKAVGNFTGKLSAVFQITKQDISEAEIRVSDVEYNGKAQTPEVAVILKDGSELPKASYEVAYSDNTEIGTATVTVTASGSYTGTLTGHFRISAYDISKASASEISDQTYTGSAIKPTVELTYDGKALTAGVDYEITGYTNNTNASSGDKKAEISIAGKGAYAGVKTVEFAIIPKDIAKCTISEIADQEWTGKAVEPALTISGLVKDIDYTVTYTDNVDVTDKAQATVTGIGNYTGSTTIYFTIKQSVKDISAAVVSDIAAQEYTGGQITPDVTVTYSGTALVYGVDYTVTYENNINVTSAAKKAAAVIKGKGGYTSQIRSEFVITPKNISKCSVDSISGQIYTGSAITPDVTVHDGDRVLEKNTDYTVSYSNNTDATTTAKAVVTGKGNYTGTQEVQFVIAKEVVDISKAVISDIADQYYNFGEELIPDVTVTLNGKVLTKGTDYTVTYSGNKNEGTATVTVNGINQSKGKIEKTFKVLPIDISTAQISLSSDTYPYTGSAVAAKVTGITVDRSGKKVELTDLSTFEITCTDNINVGKATVTVSAIEKSGFTGSASRNYTIAANDISSAVVTLDSGVYVYTGKAIEPACKVTLGGADLIEGTDYKVTYENNINVTDSAKLNVQGLGSYSGTVTKKFVIAANSIASAKVTAEAAEYTGKAITPAVTVVLDGQTLEKGKDYTLSYTDNINVTSDAKKAQVTVTGTGNYAGTVNGQFDITPMSVVKLTIEDVADQTYTGQSVKPALVVKNGDTILTAGVDYNITYEDNDVVTEKAKAVLEGRGNYTGTVSKTFAIKAADISKADISGIQDSVVYTGSAIEMSGLVIELNDNTLVQGTDYDVAYESNINVTTDNAPAYVVITGKNNYFGTIKRQFAVVAKNITKCSVDPIGGQIYTGDAIEPDVVVRDGDRILKAFVDYDVEYSDNTEVTTAAQVKITGKGNYKGSISTTFTISKDIIDISNAEISAVPDQYYNFGAEIKPDVTVVNKGKTLVRNVDYEIVYGNNVNEGTAEIHVKGINANTGSVSTTFKILPVDISDSDVSLDNASYTYTGNEIKPGIKLLVVMRDSQDVSVTAMDSFDITYSDNINAGNGKVMIAAKKGSGFTGTVNVPFTISQRDLSKAEVTVKNAAYTGTAVTPEYTVVLDGKKLADTKDFTVVCRNNINVGNSAVLTITGAGNYTGSCVENFAIYAKDISSAVVKVENATYSGLAQKPVVSVKIGETTLQKDVDYTVAYSNNINVTSDGSKAVATIQGTGNYTGTLTATFEISAADISAAIVSEVDAQRYTGAEVKPAVAITLGGRTLKAGDDYTLEYKNNVEVSDEAVIVITGKGNYTGTVEKKFSIYKVSIVKAYITGIASSVVYTGSAIEFSNLAVSVDGAVLVKDRDYVVEYSDNIAVSSKAAVKISGTGVYGGVIVKTFAITAKNTNACSVDAINGQQYTGKAVTPAVTVRDGAVVLSEGTDYTVEYSNNINVTTNDSMATVTITGKGNYTGTISAEFAISKNVTDISKAVISKIEDQYYNFGTEITPDVTVTLNGKTLTKGTDYALVYVDNVMEGTASVYVKGINNSTGTVSAHFEILPVNISDAVIAIDAASYLYTGEAIQPEIKSITVNRAGKKTEITNFDNLNIRYTANVEVGTGMITVSAISGQGFDGSVSRKFAIVGSSVENATIKISDGIYTGEPVIPDYTVMLGDRVLVNGIDYSAEFKDNVNAGDSAVLTVTGINNYTGTQTQTFKIASKDIKTAEVTTISAVYTGEKLTPEVTVRLDGVVLVNGKDYTVDYTDNVNVTTPDNRAKVKVTGTGNYSGTISAEFDITARDITLAEISDIGVQNYTGKPVTPDVKVVDGARQLKQDVDYTVTYKNNTTVTDTAYVVITGKGNYTGTVTRVFAISGLDISGAKISGIKNSVVYTGKEITFAGLRLVYDDEVLVQGTDYTVSYGDNKNVTDKATLKITGKGNYSGSVIKNFAITAKNISDKDCHVNEISSQIYTGKKLEPDVAITYGDTTLLETVDYEVTYTNNVGPASTADPAKATIVGKGNYTGTVEIEFTITKNPKSISSAKIDDINDQIFAKDFITPDVKVTYNGGSLVQGTDYKVSYANNYNAGTATVYVTGYGDYIGSKTTTFKITKKSVDGFAITLNKDKATYTGNAVKPVVDKVADAAGEWVLDDDEFAGFVVKYADNINAGTAKITLVAGGSSNYTGSITAEYQIVPAAIDNANVNVTDYEYTGSEIIPEIELIVNGVILSESDYSVDYTNNINAGSAEITVKGKGNYTGTCNSTFNIIPKSIKACEVTYSDSVNSHGVPEVTVKDGDIKLIQDKDYELVYTVDEETGRQGTIVITGKGNYKDSLTREISIEQIDISNAEVGGIKDMVFTGEALTQNVSVSAGGVALVRGRDYQLDYKNNIHAGTATVIITGTGDYMGSIRKTFEIAPADITETAVITGIEDEVTCGGDAFEFSEISVKWNDIILRDGVDYSITYQGNSNLTVNSTGQASCVVTFAGDYTGKITKQFRIRAFDLSKATVTNIADLGYNGKQLTPRLTVKIGGGVVPSANYKVVYSNNVNPGVAKITITGQNIVYGSKQITFNIRPAKVTGMKLKSRTSSSAAISWNKVAGAKAYKIYKSVGSGKYVQIGDVKTNSFKVTKLSAGTKYNIKVQAYVTAGKTLYGDAAVLGVTTTPGAVKNLKVKSRTAASLTITWSKVANASGYIVYRYSGGKYRKVKTISNKNTVKYIGSKLKAGTEYRYKVVAFKKDGKSIVSNSGAAIRTITAPKTPVVKVKASAKKAAVSWKKTSGVKGYIVYMSTSKKGKYKKVATLKSASKVKYIKKGLKKGKTYYFKVRTYKVYKGKTVYSSYSKVKSVKVK